MQPRATFNEVAGADHECALDYVPNKTKHVRSDALATSAEDGHQMSGLIHYPHFEPLMSGALEDIEMDEDVQSSVPATSSPYHIPGTYPYPPALPEYPSIEPSTSNEQASADLTPAQEMKTDDLATSDKQASGELAIAHNMDTDDLATSEEQAIDDVGTPLSEASDEPRTPEAQPAITFPSQQVDTPPRNYKGELLDDWQIRICKEFQTIHPPPSHIRQQATSVPKQLQGLNPTGLIELHQSPLANGSLIAHHQSLKTTTTGLIDSHWSPMVSVSGTGTAYGTMDAYRSTTGLLHQPHGMISTGLNDSHRSPLDPHGGTTEVLLCPNTPNPIGLNDSHRSPLDVYGSTTEDLNQPNGTASTGSSDLHRSPVADVSSPVVAFVPNGPHDTTSETAHSHPEPATVRSVNSLRSPLSDTSSLNSSQGANFIGSIGSPRSPSADLSLNSPQETDSIGSIGSPRSPLADLSLIHRQLGMNPGMPVDQPGFPLTASSMESAVDALAHTDGGSSSSDRIGGATSVPLRRPVISPLPSMITAPADTPSRWSIRSLYARVQGKPKKRSPLCERINNSNIHKAPKTPKKVTWPEHGPVTATKRFVKNEAMSHPSPISSHEDSSILSSVPSDLSPLPCPIMQEEEQEASLTAPYHASPPKFGDDDRHTNHILSTGRDVSDPMLTTEHRDVPNFGDNQDLKSNSSSDNEASVKSVETPTKTTATEPSTPPFQISPMLEELTISSRRSSLRRREKEDQARKLRDAIAAEEKARKDREAAEEKARKDKEEAEEKARIKAEEEERRKKTGGRRLPIEKVVQSLDSEWDEKVRINMAKGMREQLAMTSVGNPLTRRDFGMVLPQPGTGDDPSGWLNDEIISGYLQAVVDHGHRAMGHPRGAKPRMHAFNPFFYTTLKDRGYDAVKRWSSRAKIGGNDLKNVEYVFIPCNPSRSHWTLVVVSPVRKTIEVFDSMHGASSDKVNTTKSWLRGELGHSYVDSEWTIIEDSEHPGRGKGPVQNNANDCGVFAVTTAKMVMLGVDPMAVSAEDMPLQRRRLVAELLNGGFSGEFEPRIVFE